MDISRRLIDKIRSIPDFPSKGILFRDLTPVLTDKDLSRDTINELARRLDDHELDMVIGIESRGFLFGMSLAQKLECGFAPARKKGKLPHKTISRSYKLEYGSAAIEIHSQDVLPGMKVHIHDDLLATGGTAEAVAELVSGHGAEIASFSFIVELSDLKGRKRIETFTNNIQSLVVY